MDPVNVSESPNTSLFEEYYQRWLDHPESVDPSWRAFFQGFTLGSNSKGAIGISTSGLVGNSLKQASIDYLINAYRSFGHLQAHLNPLDPDPPVASPKLLLPQFNLNNVDLDTVFNVGTFLGSGQMKLRNIVAALQEIYCGTVGVEYAHVQDQNARHWLQECVENSRLNPAFSKEKKGRILRHLHKAELFEKFLHTKYIGQKRFSLEGGETIITAIDSLVEHCPKVGVDEVVMGMAHRGRLNVMCNILRKSFDELFEQFSENYISDTIAGDGDVKYHLGYESSLKTTSGQQVEVRLSANPSHLEMVNPVVEGKARARQRIRGDTVERRKVLPLLIHGDAAVAGQGVVAETLNFSQLPGYRTGGTLHFVINNQIGFTTDPIDARSTRYCTDIAKMIEAPVFHVNGDDPEAVCMVTQFALDFRVQFKRDIFVDMYCYRRHGHNETDEPSFTQPLMYKKIAAHPLISATYTKRLTGEGSLNNTEAEAIKAEYSQALDENLTKAKTREAAKAGKRRPAINTTVVFSDSNAQFQPKYPHKSVATAISKKVVEQVFRGLTTVPANFKIHPKVQRFVDARTSAFKSGGPFDWGMGEALAFGSLLIEGTPVRLSGQDCERGTFTHRHAVFHDIESNATHTALTALTEKQAKFCVYNSLLSESAVLGFDYGYTLDYPEMLCLWEAQFGDFANGAQVVIDQFLTAGESKWQHTSSIVLLLPHGYEGQGPEHSSARLERFLQLCAQDNIQVANFTTPAQLFHALRRQMKQNFRKPLIVMLPKSLLRHPAAVSRLEDFTQGTFEEIIDDANATGKAERLIFCSGKVYYDLIDYREKNKIDNVAIVRAEQLYPLHKNRLEEVSKKYANAKLVWCQEEPENMGAARWITPHLSEIFGHQPLYAGRDAAASPAVGLLAIHRAQLEKLLRTAFTVQPSPSFSCLPNKHVRKQRIAR